jgi:predicted nuclease of predicted toxin-antitoxin system
MRILIDECLNWRLGRALTGHFAVSAQKMGWSGIKNGKLLALAVENKIRRVSHRRPQSGIPAEHESICDRSSGA